MPLLQPQATKKKKSVHNYYCRFPEGTELLLVAVKIISKKHLYCCLIVSLPFKYIKTYITLKIGFNSKNDRSVFMLANIFYLLYFKC